jgi:hypothetical protein
LAIATLPLNMERRAFSSGSFASAILPSSSLSTALSMRLTKKLATLAMRATSPPFAAIGFDGPFVDALREQQSNIDVDAFGGEGADGGRPASVAGTLIIKFLRSSSPHNRLASEMVASVSIAR